MASEINWFSQLIFLGGGGFYFTMFRWDQGCIQEFLGRVIFFLFGLVTTWTFDMVTMVKH